MLLLYQYVHIVIVFIYVYVLASCVQYIIYVCILYSWQLAIATEKEIALHSIRTLW